VRIFADLLVCLLVVFHFLFFVLESLCWEYAEKARRDLGFTGDQSEVAKVAKNQGVSNAFLAAGLVWGLLGEGREGGDGTTILTFFLACIAVAGLVGYASIQPPSRLGKAAFLAGQTGLAVGALVLLYLSKV
jgi:putative membrane protein